MSQSKMTAASGKRAWEARDIQRSERGAVMVVGSKGISGTSDDSGIRGYDPKAGRVTPTNPRSSSWHLCPEESSPRNSYDPAQHPEAPRPLVEDPSLKETQCGHREGRWGLYLYIYITVLHCPLFTSNDLWSIFFQFLNTHQYFHNCMNGIFRHIYCLTPTGKAVACVCW